MGNLLYLFVLGVIEDVVVLLKVVQHFCFNKGSVANSDEVNEGSKHAEHYGADAEVEEQHKQVNENGEYEGDD